MEPRSTRLFLCEENRCTRNAIIRKIDGKLRTPSAVDVLLFPRAVVGEINLISSPNIKRRVGIHT